ncbi:putative molybdopterin synthase catalytic subunit [Iris pallida]|uniref:Molybdopterin synthase catalytic subunit n=1 Tax=Iris pallida TaxID=29817 RepID=A0AAX6EMQ6_IRIPA|nr:putative molybdopterin synthase catalytic subunit [Iris pallida]
MAAVAGEEEDLVEIVEEPLDPARYTDHVRSASAGAIATFEGTTRDTFEGKRVVELRYEAYAPMAARQIRSICASARRRWGLVGLAVGHRVGTVAAGEASVYVAASSVHRAEALEACRFVIDEVKASAPVWKKEVYENGEVWKENREFFANKKTGGCCGDRKVRVDDEKSQQLELD